LAIARFAMGYFWAQNKRTLTEDDIDTEIKEAISLANDSGHDEVVAEIKRWNSKWEVPLRDIEEIRV
jgi:hypothetical protein